MGAYYPFVGTISGWLNPNSSFHFALGPLGRSASFRNPAGNVLTAIAPSLLLLHASFKYYTVSSLECLPRVDLPLWNRHRFTCLDWWQSSPFLAPSNGLSFQITWLFFFVSRSVKNNKKKAATLGFIWGLLCAVGWMIKEYQSLCHRMATSSLEQVTASHRGYQLIR